MCVCSQHLKCEGQREDNFGLGSPLHMCVMCVGTQMQWRYVKAENKLQVSSPLLPQVPW